MTIRDTERVNVKILRGQCCGHAECVEIAPDVFAIDSKRKAVVIDESAASEQVILSAAEACPCSAIVIEDDEGNTLFP